MEKVKLSTLSKDTIVLVDGNSNINTVSDILEDLEEYKSKEIYTTREYKASFDAESIIDNAIENEYNNGMYEDWDDSIKADVTKDDITDLQNILDRILARNPSSNIAYESDKLIEIDVCKGDILKDTIIKKYDEGKTVEELVEEYGDMSCMAEEFNCSYPPRCNESGDYCEDCWLNKIKEITEE